MQEEPCTWSVGSGLAAISFITPMHAGAARKLCMCILRQATQHKEDMYLEFFREVVRRTAALVAAWQCVGFCHGVHSARVLGSYPKLPCKLLRVSGRGPHCRAGGCLAVKLLPRCAPC